MGNYISNRLPNRYFPKIDVAPDCDWTSSYSQLSVRRTRLGPALSVRLRKVSRLVESKIKGVNKAGTNSKCPFYRGVRLIEVSVKRESTV